MSFPPAHPSHPQPPQTRHAPPRRNILRYLPTWLSWWLGYRQISAQSQSSSKLRLAAGPPSQFTISLWSFIGAFCGIAVIQAVFRHASYFVQRGVPPIIASYGASAVLVYGVLDGPLAQPRAVLGGHFLGALTGVIISKLFLLLPTQQRFDELAWLASSLACATAIVIMQLTATTHPPAGATAFLPVLDPTIRALGWYYLPIILLTSTLILAVALLTNNIQRRYPVFWLQAPSPPAPSPKANGGGAAIGASASTSESPSASVSVSPTPDEKGGMKQLKNDDNNKSQEAIIVNVV